ncbi:hypothetical protein CR194_14195 [Salipaludibacillus keqinensis]|uniref:HTH merR-type domain-containing protein n=1 Tax=Salipaludibacillus keqinensis TaxID=2045207 RepID=A0A323TDH0_9BACI|nr:hypothetical protein [Salipaludibacillus keqinensis]PYZ92800.1 hypothetical protein CR194_14195 [Salipaludibacillus keqinensis]
MRHDIQQSERSFSTKEVAEQAGIATPTVRKYGQILERNGYEFFKDGDRRIFVQSDIEALISLRDTNKSLDDTAKDRVAEQTERLAQPQNTDVAIPDTYDNLPQDPNQVKEILMFLTRELAATREMNAQLTENMTQLKTTVGRLQQDHHVISSTIGNSAQRTHTKIEKIAEEQRNHYENLIQQEKQKSELLQQELQNMREEQQKEWRAQNQFNRQLEATIKKPKFSLERLISLFRK